METNYKDIVRVWNGMYNLTYPTTDINKHSLFCNLSQLLKELADRRDKAKKPIEIDLHNGLLINGDCVLISSEGARRPEQ